MRASRLVTLLGLLQARGRMSTSQLAAELEVCERTVLRDIEALGSAGIPVYAIRGRHGGFELLDGYSGELASIQPKREPVPPGPDGVQRALIRLSPRGRRLAALLGRPGGLHLRRPAAPPAGGPDWTEAWVRIGAPEVAVLDMLALGAEVEVMEPPELRAGLARVARQISDRHAGRAPDGRDGQARIPGEA